MGGVGGVPRSARVVNAVTYLMACGAITAYAADFTQASLKHASRHCFETYMIGGQKERP